MTDIPILKQLTPWSWSNRDGRKLDLAHGGLHITMHDTDNHGVGTDALMHSRWQDATYAGGGVQAGVGVHLYVDDERCVQKLPLDEIGYHAGDGCNDLTDDVGCFRSVSIEMCVNADADHAKVARNAAQIVARIALGDPAFDWGGGTTKGTFSIERIDQHRWVTQSADPHDCPHSLRHADYGTTWEQWLVMVDEAFAARGTTPAPRPVPAPEPVYATPELPDWWAEARAQANPHDERVDGVTWHAVRRNVLAIANTYRYSRPDVKSPRSGPPIKVRDKIAVERWFELTKPGKDGKPKKEAWLVDVDGNYLYSGRFSPRIVIKPR